MFIITSTLHKVYIRIWCMSLIVVIHTIVDEGPKLAEGTRSPYKRQIQWICLQQMNNESLEFF
jgi:hypothetical protein